MAHVTITDTPSFVSYDVTTSDDGPFTVPFAVFSQDDITIEVDGVSIGTAFSFVATSTTTGGYQTGEVTLDAAVANSTVTIYRAISPVRTSDLGTGPHSRDALNSAFDRIQAQIQDLWREIQHTARARVGTPSDRLDLDVGSLLGWGADGWAGYTAVNIGVDLNLADFWEAILSNSSNSSNTRAGIGIGELNTIDAYAGATDAAKVATALAVANIRQFQLTRSFIGTGSAAIPAGCSVDYNGYINFKGANGAMHTMGEASKLLNGRIDGEGGTYTGNGVTISTGTNQLIQNTDFIDTVGPNLEFTADNAGGGIRVIGCTFQCTTSTDYAVKGPAIESLSSGIRSFIGINCNGGKFIDFQAMNFTTLVCTASSGVLFSDDCDNVIIDFTNRIAQEPTIKGTHHMIFGCFTAPGVMTLAAGAAYCHLYVQPGNTVTDNSTNTTNKAMFYPDRVWTGFASPWHQVDLPADNQIARKTWRGTNARFTEGTNSGSDTELTSHNGNLIVQRNSGAKITLGTGTIVFNSDILPAVTESLDLGSPSFEIDNAYFQNSPTVSDQRKKNLLGYIDGEEALRYLCLQEPVWFSWKPTTIAASEEEFIEEYQEWADVPIIEKGENDLPKVRFERQLVTKDRRVTIAHPEREVAHGRRHAGRFAQQVKEAMDASQIGDFGGYAYNPKTDAHELRPLEDIPLIIAALKHLAGMVGGAPAARPTRTVTLQGKPYHLDVSDLFGLFGALAQAVDGKTSEIRLASGDLLTLTHEDVSELGRQLAGKPADEVPK